jgi:hypothetical protein
LFAVDARWRSPLGDLPYSVYTQWVADDEVNGLPSRWFGLVGVEWIGGTLAGPLSGSWVAHLEVADTACEFWQAEVTYDCAYEHHIYRSGYRYEGRSLGAAMDGDGLSISLGGTLIEAGGQSWNGLLRWTNINQDGRGEGKDVRHGLSSTEQELWNLQLSHGRAMESDGLRLGRLEVGVGVQHRKDVPSGESSTDATAFLQWSWDMGSL